MDNRFEAPFPDPATTRSSSCRPSLTTLPPELLKTILEACFINSEVRYDTGHNGCLGPVASNHYTVLLSCKKFYNEGVSVYRQCTPTVLDYDLLASWGSPIPDVRKTQIKHISLRGRWPGIYSEGTEKFISKTLSTLANLKTIQLEHTLLSMRSKADNGVSDDEIWSSAGGDYMDRNRAVSLATALAIALPHVNVGFRCTAYGKDWHQVRHMLNLKIMKVC